MFIFCVLNCHFFLELLNCLWKFRGVRSVNHVDAEVEHVNYECICRVLIFQEFFKWGDCLRPRKQNEMDIPF
jgi:hypothetical protein